MSEHSERIILVTGAKQGIGYAMAEAMAEAGSTVVLADSDPAVADVASRLADSHGVRTSGWVTDVTDALAVTRLVDGVCESHGRIDYLFNNAGIIEVQPFLDVDESVWDRIMAVNAKGVFLCGQAVARAMCRSGGGAIVNVGSIASRIGIADMAVYAASKAAVMSLTRSMALALAEHDIRVNAVAPGIVDTEMWDKIDAQRADITGLASGEPTRRRIETIPLGRPATPRDVIDVAVFLLSDAARYVTGQTYNVDGGALPS